MSYYAWKYSIVKRRYKEVKEDLSIAKLCTICNDIGFVFGQLANDSVQGHISDFGYHRIFNKFNDIQNDLILLFTIQN